jgi:hypothetical protein
LNAFGWFVSLFFLHQVTQSGECMRPETNSGAQPNVAALLILQAQPSLSLIVGVTLPSGGSSCTA